jgi:hypothetical protein
MINLSTPTEQLLEEMYDEIKRADYWHLKQGGGERKVEQQVAEYQQQRMRMDSDFIGRQTEYISPRGNRWFIFDKVTKYPKDLGIHAIVFKFIYYETYGSIGCFIPAWYQPHNGAPIERSATIYTSHFFQRYSERRHIPFRSKQMIQQFMYDCTSMTMQPEKDKDGRDCFVYRIPHVGYAFAVPRDEQRVIEVRTFLSTENMTPTKLKKYEALTDWTDSDTHEQLRLINELQAANMGDNGYQPLKGLELY